MDEKKNFNLTNFILVALLVVAAFLVGKMWNEISGLKQQMAQTTTPTPIAQAQPTEQPTVLGEQQIGEITSGGAATKGSKDAKVTIVEFSEYQCPYCKKYVDGAYQQIMQKYGDQIYYIFHDFPLEFHPFAAKMAQVARCAGDEGKYWEMHDLLFKNQDTWTAQSDVSGSITQYVAQLELDKAEFNSCLSSGKYTQAIQDSIALGKSVGVTGTPTFFINGKMLVGAQPFAAFQALIDAELNK